MQLSIKLLAMAILLTTSLMAPAEQVELSSFELCLMKQLNKAEKNTRVGDLQALCKEQLKTVETTPEESGSKESVSDEPAESRLIKNRLRQEYKARNNRFAILPHKPNYILPVTFNNDPNNEGFDSAGDNREIDNLEIKFQVSFKTPFWEAPFGKNSALFFAYTGLSYWQAYNSDVSSPFRETNHQPEIFAAWSTDWKLGGWQIPYTAFGFEHQSNGRSGLGSRSWNRVYTEWAFEKDRWVVAFRPWWRIPEEQKEDPLNPEGDDNPDIDDFMGYFELQTRYQWNDHNLGVMVRNNLRSENKGAVQLDWTFPLDNKGKLRGYIQYFNGYGESLIDYNRRTNRLGVGFVLTDWL